MYPHKIYIDSIWSIVETPTILCPACQSFLCDGMEVEIQWEIAFVSWNGGNLRHRVLIPGYGQPQWHMVRCNPCLRRQELECCHNLYVPKAWQSETRMLPNTNVERF